MSRKKRQHRQRFSKREWARRDSEPLWDDVEGPWDDVEEEWDDDESWDEPDGFWEDSEDGWDSLEDVKLRSHSEREWDWESRPWRDVLDRER